MINTPYPELTLDVIKLAYDFAVWNDGIERARREYRLNPISSCGVTDCPNLRYRGRMCRNHAGPNHREQA